MNRFFKTLSSVRSMTLGFAVVATGCSSPGNATGGESQSQSADTVSPRGLVPGAYQGSGQFRDSNGGSGFYDVSYTVTVNAIEARYDFGSSIPPIAFTLDLTWSSDTEFSYAFTFEGVLEEGTGYCVGGGCHFADSGKTPAALPASPSTVPFEQTVVFNAAGVDGIGSKLVSENGTPTTIYWHDQLTLR
jgi:hypothetical protein